MTNPEEFRLIRQLESLQNEGLALVTRLAEIYPSIRVIGAEVRRRKNERESLTACLPHELLSRIFEIVYHRQKLEHRKYPRAEMILSQVSNHWRYVAAEASALWTHIHVCVVRPTGSIQAYLERSKTRPISVTFDLRDGHHHDMTSVWPHIVVHVARWRRLSIKADSAKALYQTVECLGPLSAPLLKELKLELCDNGSNSLMFDSFSSRPTFFQKPCDILHGGTPCLKTLYFDGPFQPKYWPPLSNVVTLYIHNIDQCWHFDSDFREMLTGAVSLTNLSIYREFFPSRDRPLVVPTIRTLRLRYHPRDENSYDNIWMNITAPSLEALHLVDAKDRNIEHTIDALYRNKFRFCPKLKSLVIDRCDFDTGILQKLAIAFPSVKHLTCCVRKIRPTVHMLREANYFWQHIETVHLTEDPKHTEIDVSGLRELLPDRSRPGKDVPAPKLFFAELGSFDRSREFMYFPFEFPRWQEV